MTIDLPLRISALPRLRAALLPTPLEEAPALSRALGGPRIFFKRDDLTGAGLGGNKVRKLEFILAAALEEGADTIVACGGYQSNLTRIVAAMAARAGLKTELVLAGMADESRSLIGNVLLDHIFGARVHFVTTEQRWEFGDAVESLAEDVRRRGGKPFVVPLGGSSALGMAGYVAATAELMQQLHTQGVEAQRLYVAVGSGGTYCGLALGAINLKAGYDVTGVSVSRTADYLRDKLPGDVARGAELLGLDQAPADMTLTDAYVGDGYGALSDGCVEAIALTARCEGLLLDPVYSGKAMHALIDHVRQGVIGRDETVVFLHTGGWPALFAFDPTRFTAR